MLYSNFYIENIIFTNTLTVLLKFNNLFNVFLNIGQNNLIWHSFPNFESKEQQTLFFNFCEEIKFFKCC
jgi:hypothetical protein